MFNKFFAIVGNTFAETIRQPIFGVLMWIAAGLLALNPTLAAFSLESRGDNKIMKDIGLATLLLYGLLASVFSATAVITREIESFTVLTVVSKPVSRPLFLLGKYFGVASAMAVGYLFLTTVFMMTVRHGVMEMATDKFDQPVLIFSLVALGVSLAVAIFGNYTYGWHFSTTLTALVVPLGLLALVGVLFFGPQWALQSPATDFGDLQIVFAVVLSFFAVLVLTAFAVAFATRFSPVMTLTLCAGVFTLGLLSDYYFGGRAHDGLVYQIARDIVPNFQFFWAGDALTQELLIPVRHVAMVATYTGFYTLAVLMLGVALFQTREVG